MHPTFENTEIEDFIFIFRILKLKALYLALVLTISVDFCVSRINVDLL